MAEIYAFPIGVEPHAAQDTSHTLPGRPSGVPDPVWDAVESIRAMARLADVRYREIPVPSALADFGIGVELQTRGGADGTYGESGTDRGGMDDAPIATGWIMLLYSRTPRADWSSSWRCVAFARIPLEAREHSSLAPDMYWDDMRRRMTHAREDSLSGTVTVTQNTTFGTLGVDDSAGCEMRVSFTPVTGPDMMFDAGATVGEWARFIRSTIRFDEDDIVD